MIDSYNREYGFVPYSLFFLIFHSLGYKYILFE
nr:MAG TPA: hypothetical protein [Caudoviricetes sp.]